MKVSINQPAYMPWLGYFYRINMSDVHVILDDVQFEKNSMTNRNKILMNSTEVMLTVPLKTKGKFGDLKIKDIEIEKRKNWIKKHHRSIKQAYGKHPYYDEIIPLIDSFFNQAANINSLGQLLRLNFEFLISYLEIDTKIVYSSNLVYEGKKSDLILNICNSLNGTEYISGPFGREYLKLDDFEKSNLKVSFHDYKHPVYKQEKSNKNFTSNLSILDLIFNHGKASKNFLQIDQ